MAQDRPGIMVYFDDVIPSLQCLSTEDAGRLFVAMIAYGKSGELPDFSDSAALDIAWGFIRQKIDRDNASYSRKVLHSSYGAYKREAQKHGETPLDFNAWCVQVCPDMSTSSQDMGTYPISNKEYATSSQQSAAGSKQPANKNRGVKAAKPPRAPRFTPPTVEEVAVYVRSRGSPVDPQVFIDFYAAKGWMVGKTKMTDWKAACRNAEKWERWGSTRNDVKTAADYDGGESFV